MQKSTRLIVFTGAPVLMLYWFYCRHKQARDRFIYKRVGVELQRLMDERGTDQVPETDKS